MYFEVAEVTAGEVKRYVVHSKGLAIHINDIKSTLIENLLMVIQINASLQI